MEKKVKQHSIPGIGMRIEEVTYFMLLNRTEVIQKFYQTLEAEGMLNELKVINYPSKDYEGYSYLKIYNQNATKEHMIMYLKEMTGLKNVVTFGTIPDKYDILIQADNANEVVRETKKMYEKFFFNFFRNYSEPPPHIFAKSPDESCFPAAALLILLIYGEVALFEPP